MASNFLILALILLVQCANCQFLYGANSSVLKPSNIPVFDIDVTVPAKERYRAVW